MDSLKTLKIVRTALFLGIATYLPLRLNHCITFQLQLYGKMNLISGHADSEAYKAILNATVNSWMDVVQSPSSTHELVMHQEHRM